MPAKVTEKVYLPKVIDEFKKLFSKTIIVGPAAEPGSELARYAAANEFGATITPKSGKFLAIPCRPESKGKSPREFNDLVYIKPKNSGYPGGVLARMEGGRAVAYYILKTKVVIPERAYMRTTMDDPETRGRALRIMREMMRRLLSGSASANDVFNAVGSSLAASVKQTISSNLGPANSLLTIATKKSGSTTLVDEGHLVKSISFEVN